jgi:hypothetical protein
MFGFLYAADMHRASGADLVSAVIWNPVTKAQYLARLKELFEKC